MQIIELVASNIKRLKAVRIKPNGNVVQLTGKNEQGKSSCLDAIMYALGGKSAQDEKPIRDGEEKASVEVDLGDLIVKRRWTGENTYLDVCSKDGAKYPSPQAILDKLVGELTFDPLRFSQMDPKEQANILASFAGIDLAEIAAKRKEVENERTVVGRDLKSVEAQLNALPEVDAPDTEVDVSALLESQLAANKVNAAIDALRREQVAQDRRVHDAEETVIHLREQLAVAEDRFKTAKEKASALTDEVAKSKDVDVSAITAEIASAGEVNKRVAAKRERSQKANRAAELKATYDKHTKRLAAIDKAKTDKIAAAKLPVEGLTFAESGINFKGIPFRQASSAERLRVSAAMGIALNPKLRVMFFRDASLLDDDNMAMVAKMADEFGVQIWLERVTKGENIGVCIENGEVKDFGK